MTQNLLNKGAVEMRKIRKKDVYKFTNWSKDQYGVPFKYTCYVAYKEKLYVCEELILQATTLKELKQKINKIP